MPFQHQHTLHSYEVRKKNLGHTQMTMPLTPRISRRKCVLLLSSFRQFDSAANASECRLSLKVFSNPSGDMWKANVKDIQGEVLCVSQFTLMANTSKGNKPDFHRAMVRIPLSADGGGEPPFSFTHETESRQINRRLCTPHFYSSWALNTLPRRSRVNGSLAGDEEGL
jgi:hypothetical protein